MTSMPASRNARATILAPRSWPSRPTFATSTRIGARTVAQLHEAMGALEVELTAEEAAWLDLRA